MNILYIGDIMGRPGRDVVKKLLPNLIKIKKIDFVVAQSENVSHGKGMSPRHMDELMVAGVDCFTGGDHSWDKPNLVDRLKDPTSPVIRPANVIDRPGIGSIIIEKNNKKVLVASLLGSVFPEKLAIDNPLLVIDKILDDCAEQELDAVVVNLHGDYSSEKRVIGYYLDGRASIVVGDHWHVQSADAMILPNGTAHITDVGMCGTLHSSLGIELEQIIPRWRDSVKTKQVIASEAPFQFSALLARGVTVAGASSIERISLIVD